MSFALEPANYEIKKIKFSIDVKFNDVIQDPFPNTSFFMCIIGPPKSGKTNLLVNMLNNKKIYKRVFDKVVLVMPKNSMKSIKNNIFEDLPPDQQFDELTPKVLEKIKSIRETFDEEEQDEIERNKHRPRHMLLILDDVTAELKNKENMKMLLELSTNRRHLKLSIVLLAQYLRSIPKPVRSQVTHLVAFKMPNELDSSILRDEYLNLERDLFNKLKRFVYESAHDFLFINKMDEKYFKNLSRIIMPVTEE